MERVMYISEDLIMAGVNVYCDNKEIPMRLIRNSEISNICLRMGEDRVDEILKKPLQFIEAIEAESQCIPYELIP